MKGEYLALGFGILATIGVVGFTAYQLMNKKDDKETIIKDIMVKYGDPASPAYSPMFEGTPQGLRRYDVETLKKVLTGEIR